MAHHLDETTFEDEETTRFDVGRARRSRLAVAAKALAAGLALVAGVRAAEWQHVPAVRAPAVARSPAPSVPAAQAPRPKTAAPDERAAAAPVTRRAAPVDVEARKSAGALRNLLPRYVRHWIRDQFGFAHSEMCTPAEAVFRPGQAKVVLVGAQWCPGCKQIAPLLAKVELDPAVDRLVITDDPPPAIQRGFFEVMGRSSRAWWVIGPFDPPALGNVVGGQPEIPYVLVLDGENKIVAAWNGMPGETELQRAVAPIVRQVHPAQRLESPPGPFYLGKGSVPGVDCKEVMMVSEREERVVTPPRTPPRTPQRPPHHAAQGPIARNKPAPAPPAPPKDGAFDALKGAEPRGGEEQKRETIDLASNNTHAEPTDPPTAQETPAPAIKKEVKP